MFGFGWPEFLVLFFIAVIFYAVKNRAAITALENPLRKCLVCSFEGPMKTWLRNNSVPQIITIILLLFWLVPGLIFIAWGWGKYKCPRCGALGKNMMLDNPNKSTAVFEADKKCPFCAELIKPDAIVCKHCGRDMPMISNQVQA